MYSPQSLLARVRGLIDHEANNSVDTGSINAEALFL
jgi:hypothetical protein